MLWEVAVVVNVAENLYCRPYPQLGIFQQNTTPAVHIKVLVLLAVHPPKDSKDCMCRIYVLKLYKCEMPNNPQLCQAVAPKP